MDEKRQLVVQRILTLSQQILHWQATKNWRDYQNWEDLVRMLRNCERMYQDLDRASVECRRLNRETVAFTEQYQKLTDSLDALEQFLMTAILMRG